jgi:WD40 repeat protein
LKAQNGLLYTCRVDGFINCYNLTTNELLRTIEGHKGGCESTVLEDQFLYSAGRDKLIKKWSLATGKLEMTFKGYFSLLTQLQDILPPSSTLFCIKISCSLRATTPRQPSLTKQAET